MSRSAAGVGNKGLAGRKQQAARNDHAILNAARAVFLADAKAPVAAVAERAGVGISALYRRYPSKEDLLRTLCYDGLRRYNTIAAKALEHQDDWSAFGSFLEDIVAADVHSLTVHLAGTFTVTPEIEPDVQRSSELTTALISRAHASGKLRPDAGEQDVPWILEACAAITTPDPARAAELRGRCLALLIDGLTVHAALPGPAPTPADYMWRWARR